MSLSLLRTTVCQIPAAACFIGTPRRGATSAGESALSVLPCPHCRPHSYKAAGNKWNQVAYHVRILLFLVALYVCGSLSHTTCFPEQPETRKIKVPVAACLGTPLIQGFTL